MSDYKKNLDEKNRKKTLDVLDGLYHDERDEYSFHAVFDSLDNDGFSTNTIYAYACELQRFAEYLTEANHLESVYEVSVEMLGEQKAIDIQNYMKYLRQRGVSSSGRSRSLSALRTIYQYYVELGVLAENTPRLVNIAKVKKKHQARLEKDELKELLEDVATADALPERQRKMALKSSNSRDIAIIKLLSGTGIRVSELVGLDLDDINWKHGYFKVNRKGGNDDIIEMGENVKEALLDYILTERTKNYMELNIPVEKMIDIAAKDARDNKTTALFLSTRGAKGRLTVRSVERLVKKYSTATNSLKSLSPHGLRRTYGTQYYVATGDLYAVADSLGHKSIQVTKDHYADIGSRKKQAKSFSDELLKP